jgi:uncharacterized protein (DUF3820 family)
MNEMERRSMDLPPPRGNPAATTLPFGRHKGEPLSDVPTSYLQWAARECKLSSGLRAALALELARRGAPAPPQPPPTPPPPCKYCRGTAHTYHWQQTRSGARTIRAECARCQRWVAYVAVREPYASLADASASRTPVLDVLLGFEALGIELHSDGRSVWYDPQPVLRVPAGLERLLRQVAHDLARLMGDTRKTSPTP